ncbi:MAG: hypothetical protein WAM94_10835 [Chromatiaceae bacterium]
MAKRRDLRSIALGAGLIAAALIVDGWLPIGVFVGEAEARVGRPMTPASVAGVARRTTRRTIRRTAIYASTLPRGCTTVIIEGTSLYSCGSTYYQSSGSQYVVVNVD